MRKIIILVSVVVLLTVFLVSCGSTKTCPAYGSTNVEQTNAEKC